MPGRRLKTILATIMLVAVASPPAASSRIVSPIPGHNVVNVNVSMNMEIPLADANADTMAEAQIQGRKMLYRLATSECPILKETIAKTCRLTNLNVSTQIRRNNNVTPVSLYLNGNAQFAVTLKSAEETKQQ